MNKISSGSTFFNKKVFPVIWFGFIAFFVVVNTLDGLSFSQPMFLIVPVAMAIFGYFLMRKLVWDLADEVYDGGEFLLVKNRGDEEKVWLSNIMNVNASTAVNPPRITLRLVKPGRFGGEIAFSPIRKFTLDPFARSEVAEDLIVRVDRARSQRR
ncbi:MAG TPA: hypothetical protein VKF40_16270 [Burkholderiales bacterium]|nr:hypothetical protein [Burkholderiales bacterium]